MFQFSVQLVPTYLIYGGGLNAGLRKRRFEKEAIKGRLNYDWPGNVRQLEHVVQRLVASHMNGHKINAREVQQALQGVSLATLGPQVPMVFREDDSLDQFMDRTLVGLYDHFRNLTGSHSDAARMLRTPRGSLYKRVERARARIEVNTPLD